MDVAAIEQEVLTEKSRWYLAKYYDVPSSHVVYSGRLPNALLWRVPCLHGSSPALFPVTDNDEPITTDRMTIILLKDKFRQLDNIHNQANEMFVGQCSDCGRVYFAVALEQTG